MKTELEMFFNYLYNYNYSRKGKMLLANALELVITANKIIMPYFVLNTISGTNSNNENSTQIPLAATAAGAGILLNTILPRFRDILISQARHEIQKDITLDMIKSVYGRELDTLLGAPTGSCAVITSKNYGSVGLVVPTFFSDIVPAISETIGISGILSYSYGSIGLSPLVILASYLYVAFLREKNSVKLKEDNSLLMRQSFGALMGSINNYQIAHQFGNTSHELAKLNNALSLMESSYNQVHDKGQRDALLLSVINLLGGIGTGGYLCLKDAHPSLSLTDIAMLTYYLFRFSSILDNLPQKINTFYTGLIDSKLIINFLKTESKISEPKVSLDFHLDNPPSVEFRNVTFKYQEDQQDFIQDINFSIRAGQKVAIMGPTGSGKSSLLKLLQRFYDFEGQILINDIDITEVSTDSLRAQLSVVTQESNLLENTIFDNIKYGDLQANEEDVFAAAKFAKISFDRYRFFESVKQQGANFSGGEKQRINIARSLLKKNSYIFLLDEPTSSLDQATSHEVLRILDKLTNVATILIVTHDPNVAVNADYILYVDKGKIIEEGKFFELMEKKADFYKQIAIQCDNLGISVDDIKPIKEQIEVSSEDCLNNFVEWRVGRNKM